MSVLPVKRFLIKNTGEITKEEIKDLFGLDKESQVDIAVVGKGNTLFHYINAPPK